MNYKEILEDTKVLSYEVKQLILQFESGELTITQFHNKRYYFRKKGDIKKVIELTIAFEIYQGLCDEE